MPESKSRAELHKRCVRAWFRAMAACDYPALRDLMSEDVELWTAPSVREVSIVGRDEALRRLEGVLSGGRVFEAGSLDCEVSSIIADGNQTAAQVIMRGRFPNGNAYESIYLVWQRWSEGRMSYQLELFDAAHKNQQREV